MAKKLKSHQRAHGELKIINKVCSIVLLLLFFFNISTIITQNRDIFNELQYTAPYLAGAVLLYFVHWKYSLSIVLFFIGIHTMIDNNDPASISSALFFCLSYSCIKKQNYGILIGLTTIALLTIRSINLGDNVPEAFAIILGYFALYTLFYFIVLKQIPKPVNKQLSELTKEENKLLSKMCDGMPQGTAGSEMGHKSKQETSKVMGIIRDKLGVTEDQSTDRVIYLFTKNSK